MSVKTPRRQAVAERRARLLDLRREGHSFRECADRLGYTSATAASKDAHRALQSVLLEAGKDLVRLEADRLDRLQLALWPKAMTGDTHAARELVRLMERRARMLGLDKQAELFAATAEQDHARGILTGFQTAAQAVYEAHKAQQATTQTTAPATDADADV